MVLNFDYILAPLDNHCTQRILSTGVRVLVIFHLALWVGMQDRVVVEGVLNMMDVVIGAFISSRWVVFRRLVYQGYEVQENSLKPMRIFNNRKGKWVYRESFFEQ